MNEEAFTKQFAEHLVESQHQMRAIPGNMKGKFVDFIGKIVAQLRANGVTWAKIFALAIQIYQIVSSGGGDWQKIITMIWQLFFPVNPPPIPAIEIP